MTTAQQRYLEEIREAGTRTYNGRARRPVEALAALGLIGYRYEQVPQSKGNGIEVTERFVCWPVTEPDLRVGAGLAS
jgi:hypothetical protein